MSGSLFTALTPQGALRLEPGVEVDLAAGLGAAFARGAGPGLLRLGFTQVGAALPPDLAFWRSFALRFLAARCRADDTPEPDGDVDSPE